MTVPFVTQEPLPPKAFEGLKEPGLLMTAFNRLQGETGILNAGLTLANARRVVLVDKEIVTPSEWTALTLEAGFTDAGGDAFFAVRKTVDGTVHLREVFQNVAAPSDGDVIAHLPAGYAPAGPAYITGVSDGGGGPEIASVKVIPGSGGAADLQFHTGDPTVYQVCSGQWTAVDKSLPAWTDPFRCRLPVETANPTKVVVRSVLIAARSPSVPDAGLTSVTLLHSPTLERVDGEKYPNLVVPRIDGLRERTRYRLTLWAFIE